ncbi:MAG: CHAT domain-containing protein [Flavobacteriaceae bacterium]
MRQQIFCAVLVFSTLFSSQTAIGQKNEDALQQVNDLIYQDSIVKASELLTISVDKSLTENNFETAASLIYPKGTIELLENSATDFLLTLALYNHIQNTNSLRAKYVANIGMALLYNDQGQAQKSYQYADIANQLANQVGDVQILLESEFYLSEFGLKRGDFNLLVEHNEKSLQLLKANKDIAFNLAPRVYNYKASIMHFTAKEDSANYYFQRAIDALDGLEQNAETQYYLPATIYGNWIMVKQSEGDYTMAMEYSLESVRKFNAFLANTKNHPLTSRVHGNLSITYRGIGSLYSDMGDKQRAKQFAGIGYRHAKVNFLPNTVSYFSALLMMAEANVYSTEPELAKIYLEEAEASLATIEGENRLWHEQLTSVYADYYLKLEDYPNAIAYFKKSIENYNKNQQEEYNQNRLYALMNLSKAYAYNKESELAQATALKVYDYTQRQYGEAGFMTNEALLSIAQVAYINKDYLSALTYSQKSLDIYKRRNSLKNLDKLYFEGNKPWILLLHAKSKYELLPEKNETTLLPLVLELEEAIQLLEERKFFVSTNDEIGDLIAYNLEVFDFAKKLNSELYITTRNSKYLSEVLRLHESAIYNRIRARLNLKNPEISKIPDEVRQREKLLKDGINEIFASEESADEIDVNSYVRQTENWNFFLDSLKISHPEYYKMRYAAITEEISELWEKIPNETTLVRYLFIDENLYVFIADKNNQELIALNFQKETDLIGAFNKQDATIDQISEMALSLYNRLWKPFETKIKTEKVLIFPDGELFNLSFELLTPNKIGSFKEFATESLLAKYDISYNYSLLLLKKDRKLLEFENDIVAYAPVFDGTMKAEYQIAITDSLELDHTYLTLLPQPFSADLVTKYTKRFNGDSFLNKNASKQVFGKTAKEHKIIHLGTHAESNNASPELSRLIFAKNIGDTTDINDNNLYTYEIYDQDLSANLAILTACETGKPTYQAGEGMISLAHAFNYAGSESILTSLWTIDEQSSNEIIALFYENIAEGLDKDKALRLAKLSYLSKANGRTLHPQYWAGLVLMGETAPIQLSAISSWLWWVLGAFAIILVFWSILKKRKSLPKKEGL